MVTDLEILMLVKKIQLLQQAHLHLLRQVQVEEVVAGVLRQVQEVSLNLRLQVLLLQVVQQVRVEVLHHLRVLLVLLLEVEHLIHQEVMKTNQRFQLVVKVS